MDAAQRVRTFLRTWNECDSTVITADGTRELVTKVALSKIVNIAQKDLEAILNTIEADPENAPLLDKIDIFREILTCTKGADLHEIEKTLGLTDWEAGPNTEIAKKRILDCYLLKNNELDLSNLNLAGPLPACIAGAGFTHMTILQCQNNYLTTISAPSSLLYFDCCDNPYLSAVPNKLPDVDVFLCVNCPSLVLPELSKLPEVQTFVSDTVMFGETFSEPFSEPFSETFSETEVWLRLRDWDAGPNTDEAKDRIIACYERGEKELDLSGLGLTEFPPHLNRLHLTTLNYSGNSSRVPKHFSVENLFV
jgi:hypothetical protein